MDLFTIWDRDVEEVTQEGIHYLGGFVDFAQCAQRYAREQGGDGHCVGECSSLTDPKFFLFYTERLPTRIAFQNTGLLQSLIQKEPTDGDRLADMKKKILASGFTLRDVE